MRTLSPVLMAKLKLSITFLLCLVLLSGCGFRVKQVSDLPTDLRKLTVISEDNESQLYRQLKKQLDRAKVIYSDVNRADRAELLLFKDKLDRRTLSLFKNGQVAEYELTYHVSYQLNRPGDEAIKKNFELYRTYQDDPNSALAKAKELDIILSEMRTQASYRILRELSKL